MARETYVCKCLNEDVNEMVFLYESFGWELISNNVAASISSASATMLTHEAALNDLTFSRDKGASWYEEVSSLEDEYNDLEDTIEQINNTNPNKEMKFNGILFIFLLLVCGIGLIYLAIYLILFVKNSIDTNKWHRENDSKIDELENKQLQIVDRCREIVQGK